MKSKFIFIGITVLVAMISIATFNPIIGPLSRSLGLSEIQSGILVTVTGVCWIIGNFVWGKWASRSRKSILVAALFIYALTLFAFAYTSDEAQLHANASLYWTLLGLRAVGDFSMERFPLWLKDISCRGLCG